MLPSSGKRIGVLLFAAAAAVLFASQSKAEEDAIGKQEFRLRCAACHGASGLGDGPVGQLLKTPAANLTLLAQKNGGVFPFDNVYQVVDGRAQVAAHGTREMPVWGDVYRAELQATTIDQAAALELGAQRRVLAIVYYIGTLQAK